MKLSKTGTNFGVFGGSFDPPHMSHVLACLWAIETGEVERIIMIPCGQHALDKEIHASFEDRLAMCRLAVERLGDTVEVLDVEGRRPEVSYTVDTLRQLRNERPNSRWRLLIGSDILSQTSQWKQWDEIERLAPPLVVPRMTGDMTDRAAPQDLGALSSTWLRERLAAGDVPPGVIPASVLRYIIERRLYRAKQSE